MIGSATLKADFADRLNQTPATARAQIPCSAPEIPRSAPRISLFRPGRENHKDIKRLVLRQNSGQLQLAELEKKKNFPVPTQEQGNSATATRPEEARANAAAQPDSHRDSYQPIYAEQARKLCAHGLSETDVADFLNVTRATLDGWRRCHPDFTAALARGKAAADNRVELSLYQRACGYDRQVEKIFTPARAEDRSGSSSANASRPIRARGSPGSAFVVRNNGEINANGPAPAGNDWLSSARQLPQSPSNAARDRTPSASARSVSAPPRSGRSIARSPPLLAGLE
ncbi:MAG: hypothetical protein ABI810_19595 [Sphingomonas bacterium]